MTTKTLRVVFAEALPPVEHEVVDAVAAAAVEGRLQGVGKMLAAVVVEDFFCELPCRAALLRQKLRQLAGADVARGRQAQVDLFFKF